MRWYIDHIRSGRWWIVAGAGVLALVSVLYAAARLEFRNKRSDLLSRDLGYNRRWFEYVRQFGEDGLKAVKSAARVIANGAAQRVPCRR